MLGSDRSRTALDLLSGMGGIVSQEWGLRERVFDVGGKLMRMCDVGEAMDGAMAMAMKATNGEGDEGNQWRGR